MALPKIDKLSTKYEKTSNQDVIKKIILTKLEEKDPLSQNGILW